MFVSVVSVDLWHTGPSGSELVRLGRRHFPEAPRTKQASLDSLSATESSHNQLQETNP